MIPQSFDLSGKIALVTGAARGIGLAIAKTLAAHGAAVAIQDLDLAAAQAEVGAINAAGGRAIALGGDMADINILPGLVEQTVAQLGGLHILVNNAGIQNREHWSKLPTETVLRQWTANMLAPLRLCQLVHGRFLEQKFGRIINISSVQARRGVPHMLGYSMSKAALQNMTSGIGGDRDFVRHNITANAIAPGMFDTLRNKDSLKSLEDKVDSGKRIPVGRVGEPQDCAGIALMLCSDGASYITGETITVAGGW